jgi:hypothetical protein
MQVTRSLALTQQPGAALCATHNRQPFLATVSEIASDSPVPSINSTRPQRHRQAAYPSSLPPSRFWSIRLVSLGWSSIAKPSHNPLLSVLSSSHPKWHPPRPHPKPRESQQIPAVVYLSRSKYPPSIGKTPHGGVLSVRSYKRSAVPSPSPDVYTQNCLQRTPVHRQKMSWLPREMSLKTTF